MACHSHKADVCLNCQKETKTTLWEVEGWVKKEKKKKKMTPSLVNKKTERLNDTELYPYKRAAISGVPPESAAVSKLGMMGNIQDFN